MSRNSKCERYWPTNEGLVEVFGSFHVENSNEARVFDSNNQITPDAIKRKLGVRHPFQGIYFTIRLPSITKFFNSYSKILCFLIFLQIKENYIVLITFNLLDGQKMERPIQLSRLLI